MYRTVYLHFVTKIDRPLMEDLAHGLVSNNAAGLVAKVFDEYLDVISLDANLFTLNLPDSFVRYNDPKMTETDIRRYISRLCIGLVSLVRVLGVLPIIRAASGGPAEMLAVELCNSLRECLSPRGSAHSIFGDFLVSDRPRPLLLIADRSSDFTSPLLHASSYQALVDDLLDLHLNKVSVMAPAKTGPPTKKTYDLNSQQDPFFSRFACAPFPEAIQAHEKELAAVLKRESEIRSSKPSASGDTFDLNPSSAQSASTTSLSEAVTSLPEIIAKKANLQAHANILQAVMKVVAARDVPTFFELEQTILESGSIDKAAVLSLLREGAKGSNDDRGRLLAFIVLLVQSGDKSAAANALIEEYLAAFTEGCQAASADPSSSATEGSVPTDPAKILSAVAFLRKLQKLQSPMSGYGGAGGGNGGEGKSAAMITTFLSNATRYAANSIMMLAGSTFTALPLSRVVDNLAEGRACPEDDSFCYLDPRLPTNQQGQARVSGQKFGEVVVFMVGGGCLMEHQNLQDLLQQKRASSASTTSSASGGGAGTALRNVMYGGSEIFNSEGFLKQLFQLGGGAS
jgi:sec1 family domain-containing protein 1